MATPAAVKKKGRVGRPSIDPPENREEQLLAIARRLFAQQGFNSTSLRDIAEAAKITKAALYYYFPDKDELYERVVIESLQNLLATVSAEVAKATTPAERVRTFMLSTADFLDSERDHWLAAANAFREAGQTERRGVALQLRDAYEKLLRSCITDGVASGDFCELDPAMTGRFLLGGLTHVTRWHSPGRGLNVREVTEQFLKLALLGMQARGEPVKAGMRVSGKAKKSVERVTKKVAKG